VRESTAATPHSTRTHGTGARSSSSRRSKTCGNGRNVLAGHSPELNFHDWLRTEDLGLTDMAPRRSSRSRWVGWARLGPSEQGAPGALTAQGFRPRNGFFGACGIQADGKYSISGCSFLTLGGHDQRVSASRRPAVGAGNRRLLRHGRERAYARRRSARLSSTPAKKCQTAPPVVAGWTSRPACKGGPRDAWRGSR